MKLGPSGFGTSVCSRARRCLEGVGVQDGGPGRHRAGECNRSITGVERAVKPRVQTEVRTMG